ncbi:unnamed protein product, partial [marine sediment metagenome]
NVITNIGASEVKSDLITGMGEVAVAAGDSFLLSDVGSSGDLKRDTVDGILDLYASKTATFTNKSLDCDGTGNVLTNVGASEVKSDVITGQGEVVIATGDSILLSDVGSSGDLKRDTVDGVLDLYASKTATLTNKTLDADGTGNTISNVDIGNCIAASKAEAEAGTDNTKMLTSLRVAEEIAALGNSGTVTASSSDTFTNKSIDADGTGNVITNIDIGNSIAASKAEAEAGSDNTKLVTSLRVAEAIAALGNSGTVTASSSDTFTNKSIDADGTGNVITNIGSSEIKSEMITGMSEVAVAVGDSFLLSDVGSSGDLKRDTVDGVLDLYASKTATFTNKSMDCDGTGNVLTNVGASEVKSDVITGQGEVTIATGDSILLSDVGSSGDLKRDTVDGVLDLYAAKTATLTNKTFDADGTGNTLSNAGHEIVLIDYSETVNIIGSIGGGAQNIDMELGNVASGT